MQYEPHEYANLFPMMDKDEYKKLLDSLTENGYRAETPIVLYGGKILDGRNRYQACQELNILPMFTQYVGEDYDAFKFAVDSNVTRKHWTKDQMKAFAADYAVTEHKLAEAAKSAGGKKGGGDHKSAEYKNQVVVDSSTTCSEPESEQQKEKKKRKPAATEKAGAKFGVSRKEVERAEKLLRSCPDLFQAVKNGKMKLKAAEDEKKIREMKDEYPDLFASIRSGKMDLKKANSEIKARLRKEKIEQQKEEIKNGGGSLPQGVFEVIVIDPPWGYGTEYDPNGRRAANPYPEMSLEQIAALAIPSADDCILWLWTTHKFMRNSFALLDAWGFRDVMIVTWVKDRMGLGTWLRSKSEFCIMAVKGKPTIELTNQTTVIYGKLREHSRKPDEFYEMVDSLCVGRKLDYFSREKRDGWEQFGNDVSKF